MLSACSNPTASTDYQAKFNFEQIKNYSLYSRNSSFTEVQNLTDVMRNRIEIVLEQALEKKGLAYQEVEQANVIVSYYVVSRSAKEFKNYNREVKYCQYCLTSLYGDNEYSSKKSKNKFNHAILGRLIIDLISGENGRSIWRSSFPLDIDVKDNSEQVKDKIANAVDVMLSPLPVAVNNAN